MPSDTCLSINIHYLRSLAHLWFPFHNVIISRARLQQDGREERNKDDTIHKSFAKVLYLFIFKICNSI